MTGQFNRSAVPVLRRPNDHREHARKFFIFHPTPTNRPMK